ncbi:MAG: exodeoxyribonuclease VII large subunit [Aquihabitans sp.]
MTDGSLFDDTTLGGPPTLTVGELSTRIAQLTATAFPGDLWVEGQLRNLSRSKPGHVYFDLVEPTAAGQPVQAQVSITLLVPEKKHVNEQLKRAGGAVRMEDGIEVRIQGRLRWYAPRGTLQFRMHGIDPAFTLGRLQADRDRILAALAADGVLDANRACPLPLVPLRIGLVTSVGSAAHADVLSELENSGFGFTVRSVDARTQGIDCGPSVTRALRLLAADDVDLVLLVRGGGARTDLAGFDTDMIARAIGAMPVPVFTGIGHEVDRSIADEVAHRAHKTPTAAAADVVTMVRAFLDRVEERWSTGRRAALAATAVASGSLDRRTTRVTRLAERAVTRQAVRLEDDATRIVRGGTRTLQRAETVVDQQGMGLVVAARRGLVRAGQGLEVMGARARVHDPALALARGWTITTTLDGNPVGPLRSLAVGTELRTRFVDGSVTSTVAAVDLEVAPLPSANGFDTDSTSPPVPPDSPIAPDDVLPSTSHESRPT